MSTRSVLSPQKREEIQELKRVTESMSPSLRKAGDKARTLMEKMLNNALATNWEVGKILTTACENEQDPDEARHALIVYTDISPRYMDQWIAFYRAFRDEAARDYLLNARLKLRGTPLNWTHIQKLLTVSDPAEIRKLIDQTCAHDWSVEELQAAIDKLFNKTVGERHAGGRPITVPRTLMNRLANLQKVVGFVPRNARGIYQHPQYAILKDITELPADKITPELIDSLNACMKVLTEAEEATRSLQGDLQRALAIAEERVSVQSQQMAEREADEIDRGKGRPKK